MNPGSFQSHIQSLDAGANCSTQDASLLVTLAVAESGGMYASPLRAKSFPQVATLLDGDLIIMESGGKTSLHLL